MKKIVLKKRNKRCEEKDAILTVLDNQIASTEKALSAAKAEFMHIKPGDMLWIDTGKRTKDGDEIYQNVLQYEVQARVIDTLEKDLALLIERREQVTHPRVDPNTLEWYERLDWTELIKALGVCTAAGAQMYIMWRLQTNDGVLFGRETAKIQFPRP